MSQTKMSFVTPPDGVNERVLAVALACATAAAKSIREAGFGRYELIVLSIEVPHLGQKVTMEVERMPLADEPEEPARR